MSLGVMVGRSSKSRWRMVCSLAVEAVAGQRQRPRRVALNLFEFVALILLGLEAIYKELKEQQPVVESSRMKNL
jgi:hypothetical protein